VLKTAVDSQGNSVHSVYALGAVELRRASWDGADYERSLWTEVPYLLADGVRLARLHYATEDVPRLQSGQLHVLLHLADHLGSSSGVIDRDTSEVVERSAYQAYGTSDSDYRPSRWEHFREDYRFTGKEDDVEVGVQYFGKRYLVALLGRWLSADPLTVHGLGADPNAYAYVSGRVLRVTDPVGLDGAAQICRPNDGQSCSTDQTEYFQQEAAGPPLGPPATAEHTQTLVDKAVKRSSIPVPRPAPIQGPVTDSPARLYSSPLREAGKQLSAELDRGDGIHKAAVAVGMIIIAPFDWFTDFPNIGAQLHEHSSQFNYAMNYGTNAEVVFAGVALAGTVGDLKLTMPHFSARGTTGRHGDFHGPWRELDRTQKWGEYLRQKTGTGPPAGMQNPHAHHGVFKEGRPGPMRDAVLESQDIVRRRAGVDPIWGVDNLGWAPNRGHSTSVAQDILERLRALDAANGTPEDFRALLRTFQEEAARR
jgi:RHS repeat-associated protein